MIAKIKRFIKREIKTFSELAKHLSYRYRCPFCGYYSKDLSPVGYDITVAKEKQIIGGGLRFAGCHKCGSTDRERLIYLFLKDKINLFNFDKNKNILHFAPEKRLSKKLFEFGFNKYICCDLSPELFNTTIGIQKIDILDIPFDDNSFDLIICNHVLEHVPNDLHALKELRRVLKFDGFAILQVPISKNSYNTFEDFSITDPDQKKIFFGQKDHVRIYGQDYV